MLCAIVTIGGCCPDSSTREASNNYDVRVADRTYILSVFVLILQLEA